MRLFLVFWCFSNEYAIFEIKVLIKFFVFNGMLLISLLVVMYEYLLIKAAPAGGKMNFEFNICANNHPSSNILSHLISHPISSLISSLNSYLV